MITELKLTNFKAFGATQRIPIKPLTLIFGANSSGKSSILHSLLLANHAQASGNFDVHCPQLAERTVDLGGIVNYVHRHDGGRTISQHFELEIEAEPLKTSLRLAGASDTEAAPFMKFKRFGLTVEWSAAAPNLRQISISLDGIPVLLLKNAGNDKFTAKPLPGIVEVLGAEMRRMLQDSKPDLTDMSLFLQALESAYRDGWFACNQFTLADSGPELMRRWPVGRGQLADGNWAGVADFFRDNRDEERELHNEPEAQALRFNLSTVLHCCSVKMADMVKTLRYLGPLREVPARYFTDSLRPDKRLAADNAAWTRLLHDSPQADSLRAVVNRWLRDGLKAKYFMRVNHLKDDAGNQRGTFPEFVDDVTATTLSHRDLGFGMSQVLPVLVEAAAQAGRLIAIEQPELHLHPAQQAELGDVFIESALGERKNTFILETHSEHLILRILRRVRETTADVANGLPPLRPEDVSVLYVQPGANGAEVIELPVTPDGDFDRPWPGGFFAERFNDLP